MARLFGFDYKSPYFYMVTLKALKGAEAFSQIGPKGLIENEITKAFNTDNLILGKLSVSDCYRTISVNFSLQFGLAFFDFCDSLVASLSYFRVELFCGF